MSTIGLVLSDHCDRIVRLDDELPKAAATALLPFRGVWCPYCVASWKDLEEIAHQFRALDVAVLGVSADSPPRLREFRERLGLSFTMLSDPLLTTARALDAPLATKANVVATAMLHPLVRSYPKRSFMQPALFVWRTNGSLAHSWRQIQSNVINLYGARGRPRADQVLAVVSDVVNGSGHANLGT